MGLIRRRDKQMLTVVERNAIKNLARAVKRLPPSLQLEDDDEIRIDDLSVYKESGDISVTINLRTEGRGEIIIGKAYLRTGGTV